MHLGNSSLNDLEVVRARRTPTVSRNFSPNFCTLKAESGFLLEIFSHEVPDTESTAVGQADSGL